MARDQGPLYRPGAALRDWEESAVMSRWLRMSRALVLAGLATALPIRAGADREASDAARVDWAAGLVIAGGTGIADRHAPSPAVALGTSRRGAEDDARQRI